MLLKIKTRFVGGVVLARIIVVGSINMDIVTMMDRFPLPGETVRGKETMFNVGGKGANQAVAAALAGSDVIFVAAVGGDAFADTILCGLKKFGIKTDYVLRKPGISGLAIITVDAHGQNSIVVTPGANECLTYDDIHRLEYLFEEASALLVQNEISWDITLCAIDIARRRGVPVWLNPAPALRIDPEQFHKIDVIILNETEITEITGCIASDGSMMDRAVSKLLAAGIREVILTMGDKGCRYYSIDGTKFNIPAYQVEAVDTTAAGDAFIGAYSHAANSGYSTKDALNFASAGAAIAVTRKGAQSSMATKNEISIFLSEHERT